MYRLSLLLVCACALAAASHINSLGKPYYPLEEAEIHFEAFIEKYNRSYSSEDEKKMRFEIFKENLEMINNYNLDPLKSLHGITKFTDLTKEEFLRRYTGLDTSLHVPGVMVNISGPVTIDLPDTFSWVDQGVVTPVKDQGKTGCGSCWAFAAIGTLESSYARNHGSLLQFSEQQLVDCDTTNHGCNGGDIGYGLRYIQSAGGVEGEDDYPYTAKQGSCQFDTSKVKATVAQANNCNLQSEEALRQALYTDGPIALVVNGNLLSYTSGIWKLSDCPASPTDHGVLLVGYGTENGVPFWTIKNSWGADFGESGYFRISRNENTCGLLNPYAYVAVAG